MKDFLLELMGVVSEAFKKAGYDVWLWDNQYQQDHNYPWNFTLNSIMFNNNIPV